MYCCASYSSILGPLTLACNETHLVGLWIDGQKYFGQPLSQPMSPVLQGQEEPEPLKASRSWLVQYFSGRNPLPSELPLAPEGSEFRRLIWDILCQIPYGQVVTYGQIAQEAAARMGRPSMSGQAVGNAVGHNPISIIIPCHRVVGSNGSLTGYAGGIEKKIRLLKLEGVDLSRFSVPKTGTAL